MHEEFPTDDPAVVTCGLPYANGDLQVTTAGPSVGNSSCILRVAPSRGKTPLIFLCHYQGVRTRIPGARRGRLVTPSSATSRKKPYSTAESDAIPDGTPPMPSQPSSVRRSTCPAVVPA